ncbi:hypothetical protein ACUY3C_03595 [Corynebacterium marquesiae]|uniref:hypothetical protein n=1 Tax=Corynebacterium TaxID=1716 RepID=UPI0018E17296|nr:hypothetical protein [Corynebacterium sp.]MBS5997106.1 hypothetical protein [Corynebacterium sp.]QQA98658.1 hypothetical protein I6H50_08555 [Corynebacterium tuberculostearicum]
MMELDSTQKDEVVVITSEEGALLLGPETELAQLNSSDTLSPVSPELLRRVSKALTGIEKYQEQSGRWLKLDTESAKYLQLHGVKTRDIRAGVIRVKDLPYNFTSRPGGSLLKHLKFEQTGLLTPAAPIALASMMQQASVERQIEQMQDYLESIDAKLDAVLRFQKDSLAGEIDGIAEVLKEALLVMERTKGVTDTQWATVQQLHGELFKLQGRVLRHLSAIAEKMAQSKTSPGKVKETFQDTNTDARFWLHELARTVQLQNQMYVLQLKRVDAVEGESADGYTAAVAISREKRASRLVESLSAIARTSHELGDFPLLRKAIDWNSPRAVQEINHLFSQLRDFSKAADLDVEGAEDLEPVRHVAAARELTSAGAAKTRQAAVAGTTLARETASTAQQRATEVGENVAQRARQAWHATRGALEGATRGAFEGAAKGIAEAKSTERTNLGIDESDKHLN